MILNDLRIISISSNLKPLYGVNVCSTNYEKMKKYLSAKITLFQNLPTREIK